MLDNQSIINIKIPAIILWIILAIKNGEYLILLSFIILNVWTWIEMPPKEINITDSIALIFNETFKRLTYFNPCVISKIPLIIELRKELIDKLLLIIVATIRKNETVPKISNKVFIPLLIESVIIFPKLLL